MQVPDRRCYVYQLNQCFQRGQVAMQTTPNAQRSIAQIIRGILATGRITRADEKVVFRALVTETRLDADEMDLIQRVLDRLNRGLIRVCD